MPEGNPKSFCVPWRKKTNADMIRSTLCRYGVTAQPSHFDRLPHHYVLTRRNQSAHRQGPRHGAKPTPSKCRSTAANAPGPLGEFLDHVNLVQYDQQITSTSVSARSRASATTREFDDEGLKAAVDEAYDAAQKARDNPNLPALVKGPQDYIPVDAALPSDRGLRSGRARAHGSSSRSTSARRRACSAPATSRRRIRRRASRTRRAVRLLPVRGNRIHPHLPHAERHRIGLGRASPARRTRR